MDLTGNKFVSVGLLFLSTVIILKFISTIMSPTSGKKRLPPSVKGLPFIGGLIRLVKGPMILIREEYQKLGGAFTVNLLNRKITFLVGPEESTHFFKASEADLSQQEVYQFNVPIFGPGVLYDVDFSVRQDHFRFFHDSVRATKLKSYVDQMVVEAENYFSKWGDSGTVDLAYELKHLLLLSASRCMLGIEVREELFDEVTSLFHDLEEAMLPISFFFPHLPIPAHRRRGRARARLGEILATIINSRKSSGKSEHDVLQCLIDSTYRDGRPTTDDEVTGLLVAAVIAGQHTSFITSTWTGAYLLKYSKFFTDVVEEQKRLMKKHGDKIDYDTLSEMDVLHRCIKEALRLNPPLTTLFRQSHSDFSVKTKEGAEYDIPKGNIVAISPAIANRLPYIFKDPDAFDPDRFAPGREEDKMAGAFSYISFGCGRHRCPGEPYAYVQVKTIWSYLLRNFEFELVSFPEIDLNAMIASVKGNLMIKYKRRKLSAES